MSTSLMLISDETLEVTQITIVEMTGGIGSLEKEQSIKAVILAGYEKN